MEINVDNENFGLNVRKRLIDLKMSQMELAKRLNISEAYLSEILHDKKRAVYIRQRIYLLILNQNQNQK